MIIYAIGKRIKNFFKVTVTNFENTVKKHDVDLYEYTESKDTSKDGIYNVRYPGGKLKAQLYYIGGKLNGICNFYYENGRIQAREEYRDGFLEGMCKRYYVFGIIQTEEMYEKGQLISKKEFNDEGRLVKEVKYK